MDHCGQAPATQLLQPSDGALVRASTQWAGGLCKGLLVSED